MAYLAVKEEAVHSLVDKLYYLFQVLWNNKQQNKDQDSLKQMHIIFTLFVPGIITRM